MKAWALLRRTPWSAAAAVLVLLVLVFVFLAWMGLSSEGGVGAQGGPEMTRSEFRSLSLGTSRDKVEGAVGKGDGALEYNLFGGATRTAVEPMDATCVYYSRPGGHGIRGPIQLCYRDDELVSKRIYS